MPCTDYMYYLLCMCSQSFCLCTHTFCYS